VRVLVTRANRVIDAEKGLLLATSLDEWWNLPSTIDLNPKSRPHWL
jgi:hypothetical protein